MHKLLNIYAKAHQAEVRAFRIERSLQAYLVLLAASIEFGENPTACGSPFARSGDARKPRFSAVFSQTPYCSKKKFGHPTFTRPSKP